MSNTSARERQSDRFTDDSLNNPDDSIDLRAIIITLRKFKWPIILTTALFTAATALVVASMTPIYRSTATLLFEDKKEKTVFDQSFGFANNEAIQTQVEILKSRTLAARVVDELKLAEHWEYNNSLPVPEQQQNRGPLAPIKTAISGFLPGNANSDSEVQVQDEELRRDQMIRKLMGRTSVTSLRQTNLVKVSVEGVDRELATKIANGIGSGYTDFFIEQSNSRNKEAKEFLQSKVDELKVKLEESEQRLLEARRSAGISGDGGDFANQTIALFRNRLVDAQTKLEIARIQWEEVQQAGGASPSTVTFGVEGEEDLAGFQYVGSGYEVLPVVDSSPLVQRNKEGMQEARRVLGELSNRYGEKHPRVIDARSNYRTALSNLDRQIANVVSSVEKQYLAARGQVRSLEADIAREEGKAYRLSEGRVQTKEIELERDSNKTYYEEAVAELRSYQEENLQAVPMSVSDPASVPEAPVKPKKTLIVLLGFLASLFGISALLFTYESMKETVQGIQDVEKKLGIPVFGIVPVIRTGLMQKKKSIPLVPGKFEDSRGAFAEAIRTIRTSATVSDLDVHNQVIMVTSSVPSEGKSTFAANLAYSMSSLENTALIEADMRRPGLGRALGIKSNGLSDLLEGHAYLEDCMRINAIGDLDLIPVGRVPENHLELLASPEFAELMALLKERYDRIVIDLAPVQAVSDAIVVGKYADAAIYVVKADSTPLPVIKRGVDRLQEAGINVAGAVISQVDLAKVAGYGGDYYYQGYYDYYGYGETKKSSSAKRRASISRGDSEFEHQLYERSQRRNARNVSQLRRRNDDPDMQDDVIA
ncbi:MAG: polysaccharide biosynthesis tyrosine autokinase [Pseudomonadota bacterium]